MTCGLDEGSRDSVYVELQQQRGLFASNSDTAQFAGYSIVAVPDWYNHY